MFKFILFLVPLLVVCNAGVSRLSLQKSLTFEDEFNPSTHSDGLQVFCDKNRHVIRCVKQASETTHSFPDTPEHSYSGSAGAYVYKDEDCSNTDKPEGEEIAYLLMSNCEDAKSLFIYNQEKGNDHDELEVVLANGMSELCRIGGFKDGFECKSLNKPLISEDPEASTTWSDPSAGSGKPTGGDLLDDDDGVYGNDNALPQADLGGASVSDDPRFEVGTPADSKVSPPKIAPVTYCDKGAYSCLSCSAGRVCVPTKDGQKYYEISRFACSAIYPYCNYTSGVCSSTPDPSCFNLPETMESTDFICMRDGFYPDPKRCNKFYYCKNGKAYEHTCPYHPTPYYHPRLRHCVASKDFCAAETSAKFCALRGNFGRKIPVLFTNNYFMYCGVNKNVLSVDRCIGAYFYDPYAQTCRFECPYEGLFLSMEDCSKYFKCSPQPQGGFIKTELSCPDGKAFYEPDYSCIDRSKVPNCKKAHPDSFSKK